ncbi:neurofilament light polypeptide [Heracleum sosnowskyi]|uniref:Neurofilament light polypeptide n=1 Tax=Heracleum sosnowskyi TaxID=360622 RepID=A0AAD8GTB7_9APIA|nr:neurofilament light polypeptide [Heracleum sosnowskyi]
MDQHKKQNNPVFSQINSSTKALQILLSLSVLAILASQYSSLLSYLSSIKLLSYCTTDRHYIFLICNGLMLIVIKTSGLFASPTPPGTEFYRDSHVIRHHVQLSHHQSADFRENVHVKNNDVFNQFTESDNKNNVKLQSDHDMLEAKAETNTNVVTEVEEAKTEITEIIQGGECVTSTADNNEREVINDLDLVEEQQGHEEDEEEEEHEIMLWSTEELNKKCDDFIRKMKHGIKNEAPLVMV